eukprot:784014-Prorocentrum_lima.AAC.1
MVALSCFKWLLSNDQQQELIKMMNKAVASSVKRASINVDEASSTSKKRPKKQESKDVIAMVSSLFK